MRNEGSDFVILPSHLKPQKPNVFGYYIFKITSDLSSRWTYCRVVEWTADKHDCYMPTVVCIEYTFSFIVDDELFTYSR